MPDFESIEEYKEHKRQKHEEMLMKQNVPYSVKVRMSENRIRSYYITDDGMLIERDCRR